MAVYEYDCADCGTAFEVRRPIDAAVATAVACPSCGSERPRRRFSLFATAGSGGPVAPGAGCACGGACACGGH